MSELHPSPHRRFSWKKKLAFASLTTLAFFLLLELALAALRITPVTEQGDPFVGFSRQVPLFEEVAGADGAAWMQTSSGKLVWFNSQSFPKQKQPGTRRVFCLGGSTTFGRPFGDSTSYCGWLRRFLPKVDPTQQWEVINAGGVSYASYRVAAVMEELTQYEPDLFIVLSAHNEFLERRTYASMFEQGPVGVEFNAFLQKSRTWSLVSGLVGRTRRAEVDARDVLPGEVDEILNHSAGPKDYHRDDVWKEQVYRHYEWNLRRMVQLAHDAGAEIVLMTAASNLRECSPFKSEVATNLSENQQDRLHADLLQLKQAWQIVDVDQSLRLCEQVVDADPRCAEAQYYLGKSLFRLNRWEAAEQALRTAVDEDVCPLRATTSITETVRQVARSEQLMLVDFEYRLREHSRSEQGHACLGGEYFLDHVHPTIDVHRQLGLWIIEELLAAAWMQGEMPSEATIAAVRNEVESSIRSEDQGVAFRNLAKVLHWAGKFEEAAPRASDAIRLLPYDLESRFVLADCLDQMGDHGKAMEQYEELFQIGDFPRANLAYGELLLEQKELGKAKSFLLAAILSEREDHRIRAYYDLGLVHFQLGEFELALQSLQECDRLYPDNPATIALVGESESAAGDWEAAIRTFTRITEIESDNFYAHLRLAEILSEHARVNQAKHHLEIAGRLEPDNEEVRRIQAALSKPTSD